MKFTQRSDSESAPLTRRMRLQRRASTAKRNATAQQLRGATMDALEQRRLLAAFTVDPNAAETGFNYHTISAAVGQAALTSETDDTIDVVAGAFAEDVTISTPLTLRGAQQGVDPRAGRPGTESAITGHISIRAPGVTVDGFSVLSGSLDGTPATVTGAYVDASDATITNTIFTGGGSGSGVVLTASIASGTTTLSRNVIQHWATGVDISAGGSTSVVSNAIRDNSVTGVAGNFLVAAAASTLAVTGNAFDNAGVPQLTLAGGTDGEDLITLTDSVVTLRNPSTTFFSKTAPTPTALTGSSTFTLTRSTNEDTSLPIDLDVDGSGFATYNHAAIAGSVSVNDSTVTYVPTSNFNGTTNFMFTTNAGSTGTVNIIVLPINDPPTSVSIPPQAVNVGQTTTLALPGYFSDVDTADTTPDVLTYSLSGAPSFATINASTGIITFAPTAAASIGSYSFTAIATDGSSASSSQSVSLTVHRAVNTAPAFGNLPSTVTVSESATGSVFTANATDADDDHLVYSITGGNAGGNFAIDSATGLITIAQPLDAETTQSYTLTIRVTDDGEPAPVFTEKTLGVTVTDVNEAAGSVAIVGPNGGYEGTPLTFTAVATDPDVGASFTYRWFVNEVLQTSQTSSTFTVSFSSEGNRVIRVEAVDRSGAPTTASKTVAIQFVAPTIPLSLSSSSIDEGAPLTLTIGTITDPIAGHVAAIGQVAIDWGDGNYTIINSGTDAATLASIINGTPVDLTHSYSDGSNTTRAITVRVWDTQYHAYSATTSVLVRNVAPTGLFVAVTPTVQSGSIAIVNWFNQTDISPEDLQAGLRYTYAIDGNGNGLYDAGETLISGDATYEGSGSNSQILIPGSFLRTAGTYSILGLMFDKDSSPVTTQQASITVTPGPLHVISLGGDHSGFTVVFNQQFDKNGINLYDGTDVALDPADIILKKPTGQIVKGTVLFNSTGDGFDFVVTGAILQAGTYTVTLNSGATAFHDLSGAALDGDGNGFAGGNYVATFGVNAPPGPVLSLPDFARGPGQDVDVIPGTPTSDLPVTMNSPIAVSSLNFQIRYDATLLTLRNPDPANGIADVYAGAGLPAGWAVNYSLVPGAVAVSLTKTTPSAPDISLGSRELIKLRATVPNNPAIYGRSEYLSFASIVVNGNASIEGTADRAIHKVVFLGDANFDGTVNAGDSALIQSVVLTTVNGFDAYPLVDPTIIVDSSRNGAIDSQDATNAALSGFTGGRPIDVPAFTPITLPGSLGADPTFRIGQTYANASGNVSVPITVSDDARGIQAGAIRINYDPATLSLAGVPLSAGSLLGSGWTVLTNVNAAQGYIEIAFFSGAALTGATALTGGVATLNFNLASNATQGTTPITIGTPTTTATSPTIFYSNLGAHLTTGAISGSVIVDTIAPSAAPVAFTYNGGQSVSLTFSEAIASTLTAANFELVNVTSGATIALSIAGISADRRTVTLTFANTGGLTNALLRDGNYRFRVLAGGVSDAAGNALAANADSTFFFMNGDANHDRTVNFDDLLILANSYGAGGATFAAGDFNYDGVVNFDDLLILAQAYGKTLQAAAPASATPAAPTRKRSDVTAIVG